MLSWTMNRILTAASITLLLTTTSCAMGGGGGRPSAAADIRRETFAYAPAADRNVRVVINRATVRGEDGFIPKDPNWLQLHVTMTNIGRRPVTLTAVQEQVNGGVVLSWAMSSADIQKTPNIGRSAAKTIGIGAAGSLAGTFIFPPLAVVGALLRGKSMMGGTKNSLRVQNDFSATALRASTIVPGTSMSGNVFVPAVRGQTGLIVLYSVGAQQQSLVVPRSEG